MKPLASKSSSHFLRNEFIKKKDKKIKRTKEKTFVFLLYFFMSRGSLVSVYKSCQTSQMFCFSFIYLKICKSVKLGLLDTALLFFYLKINTFPVVIVLRVWLFNRYICILNISLYLKK